MSLVLYDYHRAPSPRRARIFLAEKGIEVEKVEVDLAKGEQLGADFRLINPCCTVPVLVTEEKVPLWENVAIAQYLEAYRPDPPLLGRSAVERGLIAQWNARCEFEGFLAAAEAFRNKVQGFQGRAITGPESYEQIPELAERGRKRLARFLDVLDAALEDREFLATDDFTFADITAMVCVDFAGFVKMAPKEEHEDLRRWHAAVSARPSASA